MNSTERNTLLFWSILLALSVALSLGLGVKVGGYLAKQRVQDLCIDHRGFKMNDRIFSCNLRRSDGG